MTSRLKWRVVYAPKSKEKLDAGWNCIMQDMYVGDIGDYGKYGLLRMLFPTSSGYRLGVVWYLVPDESHKSDGKFISFLSKAGFRSIDVELFDCLKRVIDFGSRNVSEIERLEVLGKNTVYFKKLLTFDGINANSDTGRQARLSLRQQWLDEALAMTDNCEAVFLDPDNGIETPSVAKYSKYGPKYCYLDDIEKFVCRGQIVIVYHHLGRNGSHEFQIRARKEQLLNSIGMGAHVESLRFRAYSPRAYFIVFNSEQKNYVESRLRVLLESQWQKCFELID